MVRISDGAKVASFSPIDSVITGLDFSNDGKWMIATSSDMFGLVRLSDFSTVYQGLQDGSGDRADSFAPDSKTMLFTSGPSVMQYSLLTGDLRHVGDITQDRAWSSAVDVERNLVFIAAQGVYAMELHTGRIIWFHPSYNAAKISPSGDMIIASGYTTDKIDVSTGKVLLSTPRYELENEIAIGSRFMPELGIFRTYKYQNKVVDVNTEDLSIRSIFSAPFSGDARLSLDGKRLLQANPTKHIVRDATTFELIAELDQSKYPNISPNLDLAPSTTFKQLTYVRIPEMTVYRKFRLDSAAAQQYHFIANSRRFVSFESNGIDLETGANFVVPGTNYDYRAPRFLTESGHLWIEDALSPYFISMFSRQYLGQSAIHFSGYPVVSSPKDESTLLATFSDGSLVAMDNPMLSTQQQLFLRNYTSEPSRDYRLTVYDSESRHKLYDSPVMFDAKRRATVQYDGPFAERCVFLKARGFLSVEGWTTICTDYPIGFQLWKRGDVDNDDEITTDDLLTIYASLGSQVGDLHWNEDADVNQDGKVSGDDIALM